MKSLRMGALACGLMLALNSHASEKRHYVIILADGKQAGEETVERGDDGLTKVHYIFKDNGRGPELDEQFRLAADGTFAEYQVKGASTFGAPVDEHFNRTGDQAEWHSTSETGKKTVSGPGFYVPLNGTLEANSAAIAAIAQRSDGKLPLIPAGTLAQRKLDEVEVTGNGRTERVQLMAYTGLGLTPQFLWTTTDAKPRLFAYVEPGYLVAVEDGWQANGKLLTEHQQAAEAALLRDMAVHLEHPLSGLTVVRNARVFDSESATLGAPSDVYMLRGKITQVLPAGSPVRADNEIDAAGRVLMPGLFDMHAHVGRWDGGLHLAAGVTTVRDMGNDNGTMQQMLGEISSGQLLSPQIVPAGFIEGQSPYSARLGFVISNFDQAKAAVDWYAEHGYPQLKVYNSFPKEILPQTVAYAHSRGMRVSGHIPVFLRAQDAVNDGFDEIQHINQVLLNFLVTPTTDTRTLERFRLPADKVAGLDFDSKPVQDFLALLKSHQTVIDSTLATFDFIRQRDGQMSAAYAEVADHLPLDLQRSLRVGSMDIPDDVTAARYEKSYEKMIEFVGRMYRDGIPLVAGTDALPGFTLQRELELYVQAGMTPAQALQIATRNGAKYTRTSNDRGSIAPGKLADLVLFDGDPTTNISDIKKVALVITQGKMILPSEVDTALGIKPFVENAPTLKVLPPVPTNNSGAASPTAMRAAAGLEGRE
jgi:hypothetical protein